VIDATSSRTIYAGTEDGKVFKGALSN